MGRPRWCHKLTGRVASATWLLRGWGDGDRLTGAGASRSAGGCWPPWSCRRAPFRHAGWVRAVIVRFWSSFFLPQPRLFCFRRLADWDCWRVAPVSAVGNDGALFLPPFRRVADARTLSDGRWSYRATAWRWVPHVAATCPAGGVWGGGLWCPARRVRVCLRWWVPSFWSRAGLLRASRWRRFCPFFWYPPIVPLLLWPCRHGRRFPPRVPPPPQGGTGRG